MLCQHQTPGFLEPELLLVDEPTASLDPKTSRQIMRLITEVCSERHLAAVVNIHDVVLAQMFLKRIVGLRAGSIVYDGPSDGLTPEVLTRIYGEEDWTKTGAKDEDDDEADLLEGEAEDDGEVEPGGRLALLRHEAVAFLEDLLLDLEEL